MGKQLSFTFTDAPALPFVPAMSITQRCAHIEDADDRRLAEAVEGSRRGIRKLLQQVFCGVGATSPEQQQGAGEILNGMDGMDALTLGKAVLQLQVRHRKTRLHISHVIVNGDLRKAGKHLPYAVPHDEQEVAEM